MSDKNNEVNMNKEWIRPDSNDVEYKGYGFEPKTQPVIPNVLQSLVNGNQPTNTQGTSTADPGAGGSGPNPSGNNSTPSGN